MISLTQKVPSVGTVVQFDGHRLDVRDVLYELIEQDFIVLAIDENRLLTVHSYPMDTTDTSVAMGIDARLLLAT